MSNNECLSVGEVLKALITIEYQVITITGTFVSDYGMSRSRRTGEIRKLFHTRTRFYVTVSFQQQITEFVLGLNCILGLIFDNIVWRIEIGEGDLFLCLDPPGMYRANIFFLTDSQSESTKFDSSHRNRSVFY